MFVSHVFGDQPVSSLSASPAIIYLGLDVHKDSVTLALVVPDDAAPPRIDPYVNDTANVRRKSDRSANDGERRACDAASGAGYVLQCAMQE